MNPCVLASQGSGGNLMKKHVRVGGEHLFILGDPGIQIPVQEISYSLIPGFVFYLYVISSLVYHSLLNLYRFRIFRYEYILYISRESQYCIFLEP